jgi:hypothetical protein
MPRGRQHRRKHNTNNNNRETGSGNADWTKLFQIGFCSHHYKYLGPITKEHYFNS